MILLVDIDGTLRNTYFSFRTYASIIGVALPEEGPQDYWFLEAYEHHPKHAQLMDIWQRPGLFANAAPYPGAVGTMHYLQSRPEFEVFLVTQPMLGSETAHSENVDWVRYTLGTDWEKRLIQTWDRTLLQADFLIDDNPTITGLVQEPTWVHTLFDQPYNRDNNQERIMNWGNFDGN